MEKQIIARGLLAGAIASVVGVRVRPHIRRAVIDKAIAYEEATGGRT